MQTEQEKKEILLQRYGYYDNWEFSKQEILETNPELFSLFYTLIENKNIVILQYPTFELDSKIKYVQSYNLYTLDELFSEIWIDRSKKLYFYSSSKLTIDINTYRYQVRVFLEK